MAELLLSTDTCFSCCFGGDFSCSGKLGELIVGWSSFLGASRLLTSPYFLKGDKEKAESVALGFWEDTFVSFMSFSDLESGEGLLALFLETHGFDGLLMFFVRVSW